MNQTNEPSKTIRPFISRALASQLAKKAVVHQMTEHIENIPIFFSKSTFCSISCRSSINYHTLEAASACSVAASEEVTRRKVNASNLLSWTSIYVLYRIKLDTEVSCDRSIYKRLLYFNSSAHSFNSLFIPDLEPITIIK